MLVAECSAVVGELLVVGEVLVVVEEIPVFAAV